MVCKAIFGGGLNRKIPVGNGNTHYRAWVRREIWELTLELTLIMELNIISLPNIYAYVLLRGLFLEMDYIGYMMLSRPLPAMDGRFLGWETSIRDESWRFLKRTVDMLWDFEI